MSAKFLRILYIKFLVKIISAYVHIYTHTYFVKENLISYFINSFLASSLGNHTGNRHNDGNSRITLIYILGKHRTASSLATKTPS